MTQLLLAFWSVFCRLYAQQLVIDVPFANDNNSCWKQFLVGMFGIASKKAVQEALNEH